MQALDVVHSNSHSIRVSIMCLHVYLPVSSLFYGCDEYSYSFGVRNDYLHAYL